MGLPADQSSLARKLFDTVDTDSSGTLDASEWRDCARSLAQISENFDDHPDGSFYRMDADQDGTVSFEEFEAELAVIAEVVGASAMKTGLTRTIAAAERDVQTSV